jgi:phytoene synthase
MTVSVEESFAYCRRVTRRRARNFYYSFVLLPPREHDALCAIYAFMRYCDDVADDPGMEPRQARQLLENWRTDLEAALGGRPAGHPVWPAFCSVAERHRIPHDYFRSIIDGVAGDLEPREFKTFEQLYRYCYSVASVAGLCIIHVLGFESPRAPELAEKCGVAFQLTNILRDVREDAGRGRVYFPAEDLERFGVKREDILGGRQDEAVGRLLRFEAARAEAYYQEAAPLVGMVSRPNRAALWALIEIYRRLLEKIERSGLQVMRGRVRLSPAHKCWVAGRAAVRRFAPW